MSASRGRVRVLGMSYSAVAKAAAILEKYSKLPPNPNANHLTYARTLDVAAIAPVLDLGAKYKTLSQSVPPADLIAQLPK